MSSNPISASRRVQWSSAPGSNKFLVSGTNELRLCEYLPSPVNHRGLHNASGKKRAASKTIGVCSDLPAFKVRDSFPSLHLYTTSHVPILNGHHGTQ